MPLLLYLTIFFAFNWCNSVISAEKAYVQKCCPYNDYVTTKNKCENNALKLGDISKLPIYDGALNQIGVLDKYLDVKILDTFDTDLKSNRRYYYMNVKKFYQNYHLMEDGKMEMLMKKKGTIKTVSAFDYCIDYQVSINNTFPANVSVWFRNEKQQDSTMDHMKFYLPVSCVFLLLVLIVYCLLPELRTLGGLVLMAYVASLMCSYMFLFSFHVRAQHFNVPTCIGMTLATYFFFLSSFCWLNVMAFDIWWTFRGYAKARPIHRRGERFKFKLYCMYAYGVPLAMTIATCLVTVNAKKLTGIIRPQIPEDGCFLEGDAKNYYLYLPLLILMICNWMFFIMTAFNIWRLSRGAKMLSSEDSAATGTNTSRHTHKQRFIMYLKLSTLMGLSWILEAVSAQVPTLSIWYLTDGYNILMGLVIFVIFVCKRKIFFMLKKRFEKEPSMWKTNIMALELKELATTVY